MNQMVSRSVVAGSAALQEPPASFRIRLVESGLFSCKYVIGEADENALCCGAPTDGKSWCAYHRSVVFDTYRFNRTR